MNGFRIFKGGCRTNQPLKHLTQASSKIAQTLAGMSAAGLVFASAGFGAVYAGTAGAPHGWLMSSLMVCMAVALECAKPLAVASALSAFRSFAIFRGGALALLAVVAIAYSLTAELSLMATARGDLVAQRRADARTAKSVDGQRNRVEAELSQLAGVRPSATVKAEIGGLLADPRVGDCSVMDGPRSKAVCPRVAALRVELGDSERREKLETDLLGLQSTPGAPSAADQSADPGAHALSVYLAVLGFNLPDRLLTDWLVLIPVVALELAAALAMVLVQSVSGVQPATQIAPAFELIRDSCPTAHSRTASLDSKMPRTRPNSVSKARHAKHASKRGLGQRVVVSKTDAQRRVISLIRDNGGKLDRASARGIACLIGGKKSTVHSALVSLIAAGVVARVGTDLMLAA